ncbi:MAG: aldehyde dehydrogenase family protein, partial [Gammaproteobacteria bacterium]|nr:aldehyde dehydrogenase family protein [Gammaproteobacteria bacterium]
MSNTLHHYVNGARVAGTSERFGDVFDPATGEVAARVPLASASETARVIDAAAAAFPAWRDTPPLRRAAILFRFKE